MLHLRHSHRSERKMEFLVVVFFLIVPNTKINILIKLFFKCKFSDKYQTYCSLKSSMGGSNLMGLDGKLPSPTLQRKYMY